MSDTPSTPAFNEPGREPTVIEPSVVVPETNPRPVIPNSTSFEVVWLDDSRPGADLNFRVVERPLSRDVLSVALPIATRRMMTSGLMHCASRSKLYSTNDETVYIP